MYGQALTLKRLAEQFASLPGIGRKSAWRLAFHILTLDENRVKIFADTILAARQTICRCEICQNLTDRNVCEICSNSARDSDIICVVEQSRDIILFEKSRSFNGLYHVLHGLISPLDGIGPDKLAIKELIKRVGDGAISEIILATSPTVEGEATAMYISKLLKPFNITASRLAYGVPVGGELQYADEMTISKAIQNRSKL